MTLFIAGLFIVGWIMIISGLFLAGVGMWDAWKIRRINQKIGKALSNSNQVWEDEDWPIESDGWPEDAEEFIKEATKRILEKEEFIRRRSNEDEEIIEPHSHSEIGHDDDEECGVMNLIGDALQDDELTEDIRDCIGKELTPDILERLTEMLSEEDITESTRRANEASRLAGSLNNDSDEDEAAETDIDKD